MSNRRVCGRSRGRYLRPRHVLRFNYSDNSRRLCGGRTPRFQRVRSRFVPSINSNHRQPPQCTRNGGAPVPRPRMYVRIDTALDRPLRLALSLSVATAATSFRCSLLPKCRDYARDRNRETGSAATSYRNTEYGELGLSPALLGRNSKQDRISFAMHVCLSRRQSPLGPTQVENDHGC